MKKLAIAIAIILVLAINWGLSANGNGEHARVNGYQQGNNAMQYDTSGPAANAGVYGKTEGWSGAPN